MVDLCLTPEKEQLMEEQNKLPEHEHKDRTVCGCKILALTLIYLVLANLMKLPFRIFLLKG